MLIDQLPETPAPAVETKTDAATETPAPPAVAEVQVKLDAAEGRAAALTVRVDAAEATAAAQTARADAAEAKLVELATRADAAEAKLASFDTRVAARVALVEAAKSVLGPTYKADGVSDRDVQVAAILKVNPEFVAEGRADAYVEGVFETAVSSGQAADAKRARLREDVRTVKADASDLPKESLFEKNRRETAEYLAKLHR
jgi:hypothetical protein